MSSLREQSNGLLKSLLELNQQTQKARRKRRQLRERSGDIIVAGIGISLGLVCAFFPWYVFFNQEKFGIRAVQFSGGSVSQTLPENLTYQPTLVGQGFSLEDVPLLELDRIATGAVPDASDPSVGEVPLSEQPFPGEDIPVPEYRVVHVANGRAMIEDEEGLYVVQAGSLLPDNSRVSAIEQRQEGWVVITSDDKVVPLSGLGR